MATNGPEAQSEQRQVRMLPLVAWTMAKAWPEHWFAMLSLGWCVWCRVSMFVHVVAVVSLGQGGWVDREREGGIQDCRYVCRSADMTGYDRSVDGGRDRT